METNHAHEIDTKLFTSLRKDWTSFAVTVFGGLAHSTIDLDLII